MGYPDQVSGLTWSRHNAAKPPSKMPTYISVIVTTEAGKTSDGAKGNIRERVVLRVDSPAGYKTDGSRSSTGMVITILQS